MVSLETIKRWLEEGSEDADNLVDLRWTIIEEYTEDGRLTGFRASHPRIPINLLVLQGKFKERAGLNFVRLVIETFIDTIDLAPEEKLKFYRALLELSKIPLTKFYLYGESDTVGIAVDLDLRSLSKNEFDDALVMLAMTYAYLKRLSSSIKEIMSKDEIVVLGALVKSYIDRGERKSDIVEYLVRNGLERELAQELVETVYTLASGGRGERKEDTLYM
jgi:hypothetical protein